MAIDDLKRVMAFVFRMKAAKHLKESAFIDILSFDLRWFPPEDAKRLLTYALESNIIIKKDDAVMPNFDTSSIEIPLTYKPGPEVFWQPAAKVVAESADTGDDVLMQILKKIEKTSSVPRKQLVSKINAVQKDMGIDIEVAALIVALDFGVEVKPLAGLVERRVLAKYEGGG